MERVLNGGQKQCTGTTSPYCLNGTCVRWGHSFFCSLSLAHFALVRTIPKSTNGACGTNYALPEQQQTASLFCTGVLQIMLNLI